jgi:NADPH:quinone reductase-like Zn-dependent oxidoreductase
MRAISLKTKLQVELRDVPKPINTEPEHLLIEMEASAINPGDKAFIGGLFPHGSQHEICGVSGVGKVIDIGEGVPPEIKGRNVAIYRSLKFTSQIIGTWSEYVQMHSQNCVLLPNDVTPIKYSGSLVNVITPYAFLKQIQNEGHIGVICTAGNSASGRAMLGLCKACKVPIITFVRDERGENELKELGAENILVKSDTEFETKLENLSSKLNTTAVFDGVGGDLISLVAKVIPKNSTIYTYGFLGGEKPLTIHTSVILMKGLTITGFGNFTSETVTNPVKLRTALNDLTEIIHMPHFKTKVVELFTIEKITSALQYSSQNGEKAVLIFQQNN